MIRLVLISLGIIFAVFYFADPFLQGQLGELSQNLQLSVGLAANAAEMEILRESVQEFLELRKIRNTPQAEQRSHELDQKINNLNLVTQHCNQKITTLQLAFETNPYKSIQESCPILKDVSLSHAANLWSRYM